MNRALILLANATKCYNVLRTTKPRFARLLARHLYSGLLRRKLDPGSPIFLLSLPRGIKAAYSLCSSVSIVPANKISYNETVDFVDLGNMTTQ